jgi:hypothetical protein
MNGLPYIVTHDGEIVAASHIEVSANDSSNRKQTDHRNNRR